MTQARNSLSDQEFRSELRGFLNEHYPAHLQQDFHRPFRRLRGDEARSWLSIVHQHGWRAPAWPTQWGGMGLSFRKQMIYHEELESSGVARIIDLAESQLGPI